MLALSLIFDITSRILQAGGARARMLEAPCYIFKAVVHRLPCVTPNTQQHTHAAYAPLVRAVKLGLRLVRLPFDVTDHLVLKLKLLRDAQTVCGVNAKPCAPYSRRAASTTPQCAAT